MLVFVTADEAVRSVKSHDHIHISSAAQVPYCLVEALQRRADVQWIVTEFGSVNLRGKSMQERAKLLISIAHPDDQKSLERAAFDRFGPHYKTISVK